jgi:predicted RecB family nuclease
MRITPELFRAYLQCPTKCWLKSAGEKSTGNVYAEWVQGQVESYRGVGIERLRSTAIPGEHVTSPSANTLKEAKWRWALDVSVQTEKLESRIHTVERAPSEGRGKPARFVPVRFITTNKLSKVDKLLLAFDAFVLAEYLKRDVGIAKIIHGRDHVMLKVKTPGLQGQVKKVTDKIVALLSINSPPDLILNRHCPECEFRYRCRQKAIEKDDLSLLAGMTENERKESNHKGIFTVTQLSYTFRPRRRPKHLRGKREKYHHSLKALALREKKIYVVGDLCFKVEGTPVYLDVESIPDLDFYYLIGARVKTEAGFVQHSFWADEIEDEARIWQEFLTLLGGLQNPCLIHYGSFEKTFLRQMCDRHGGHPENVAGVVKAIQQPLNLVSAIFAQIYFPTFSNTLKEVAGFLGFQWSEPQASRLLCIVWRETWESSRCQDQKQQLLKYNAEDCEALALVAKAVTRLAAREAVETTTPANTAETVNIDDLRDPLTTKWRDFSSPITELEFVTSAAHWDYQRDRIYVRTSKCIRRSKIRRKPTHKAIWRVDKVDMDRISSKCPHCQTEGKRKGALRCRTVQEMLFGKFSVKRRVIRHYYQPFWCPACKALFGVDHKLLGPGRRTRYGRSLIAFIFYQVIELYIPMQVVAVSMNRLFGLNLGSAICKLFKEKLAKQYAETHQEILRRIVTGPLVHADETYFSVQGKRAYVWVFTNMHEVAYIYSESREGGLAQGTLHQFRGVLVSDFYAVYDSMDCPQQKCLIHLIRDLNGTMLDNPYDQETKGLVKTFGELLKRIVDEVHRRGLKTHFLKKYLSDVRRFYCECVDREYQSPAAASCAERFKKNRDKLFTFLEYDGVPWNNNNAEHAMKAFARLRDVIEGMSTEKGLKEYLVLLSICQTCKYQGLDFLDFLRSGQTDIEAFAQQKRNDRPKPVIVD